MKISQLFPQLKKNGQILVLGELLLDFVPTNSSMRLSEPGTVVKTVSGSSGIYACAAARLGADCGFIGKVGPDPFSALALSAIEEQGVCTENVVRSPDGKLGLAFLEYTESGRNYAYYRDGSVGSMLRAEDLNEEAFRNAKLFHFPGMLLELNPSMRAACYRAVELAKKHGALISLDPNLRKEIGSDREAKDRLLTLISQADMIEPTLEEGRILTGCYEIEDVLQALHEAGPKLVVLTRDKDGAVFSFDGRVLYADGIDLPVVDPTGAGDTFAAALGYCLDRDLPLEETIAFCNCAATLVCTGYGAIGSALPDMAQVEEMMRSGVCRVRAGGRGLEG